MATRPTLTTVSDKAQEADARDLSSASWGDGAGDAGGADDAQARKAEEQESRLAAFGLMLASKRSEAIQWRASSGVEQRWLRDLDAYHGRDAMNGRTGMMDTLRGLQPNPRARKPDGQPNRATVFVQLTRQKTNAAFARVSDMLFPSDDKNWAIKPTPVPTLSKAAAQQDKSAWVENGQPLPHPEDPNRPLTIADVAADVMRVASEKAELMSKEIADVLAECQYAREGREVIRDAAKLGTGILKGPIAVNRIGKKWTKVQTPNGPVYMMERFSENKPASKRVDPWNVFPDPYCGENPQDGAYIWEREYLPAREIRKLAQVEGYLRTQIVACLNEGPMRHTSEGSYLEQRRGDSGTTPASYQDSRYELWTYIGEVDREDLAAAGVKVPEEDGLTTYSAIVVLCNNRVIKATINPLEDGSFPYDFFVWEPIDLSCWGVGIPYLMRYAQATLNAAWRAMLDNMAVAAGPQIIVNRKKVEPADGSWEVYARKAWWAIDDTPDVRTAMWTFDVPSHIQEIHTIIELAMKFADDETSLPQIAQGEKGTAPDTVGGMTILMNSANAVLRRLVKQFDDMVTEPHIRRYYDWMMAHSPKDDIKGDFQCVAVGSSALVERDQQSQGLGNVLAVAANPRFAPWFDDEKLVKMVLQASRFTADQLLNTPEQVRQIKEKMAQQPPDPRIEAAKIKAQADIKAVEIENQGELQNLEIQRQVATDAHAARMKEIEAKTQLALADYANRRQISIDQARVELTKEVMRIREAREARAQEQQHQSNEAERGRQFDQFNRAADRAAATQE